MPGYCLQPDSRPISQEQLAAEVKSIYSGLTMVEAKCVHVDEPQAACIQSAEHGELMSDDHWRALIALHRALLLEHHDFFLGSQHPSASPALRSLAEKYSMPARMWKHGIHSFLELLRYRLPDSMDHMISFIYFAYQTMALLYETVPTSLDTWIEFLGDLGRYRRAIEDEDFEDREAWAGVARSWYSKAADRSSEVGRLYRHLAIDNKRKKWIEYDRSTYSKTVDRSPRVGRLYQHVAILARPDSPQQIYPYCNTSLTDIHPFQFTRENIKSFFDPLDGSAGRDASSLLVTRIDSLYMKPNGWIHLCKRPDGFKLGFDTYVRLLSEHIELPGTNWREGGANVATSGISALLEHSKSHIVRFGRSCPPPLKTESGGSVLRGYLTRGQVWLNDFNGIKQIEPQFVEADISGGRELHVLRNSAQRMPSFFVRAIELLYRFLPSIAILKLFTLVHASPGTKHQPVQRNLATLFTHDSEPIEYRDRTPFDYAVYLFGMFLFAITQYLGKAARPVTISVELVTGLAIPLLRSDPTFRGPAIWSLLKIWGFTCGSDSILACRFSQNRRLQKVLEFLTLLFGIFTGMTLQQNRPGSFINSATVSWPVGISLSSFLVDVLPTLDSASNSIVVPNSNISIPSDDVEPGPPSTGANPEDFRINRVLHEPAHREPRSPSAWSFPRRPRTFFCLRRTRSDIPTPHDEANVPLPELPHPSNFDIDIDSIHGIVPEENSTAETPLLPHAYQSGR